MKKLLNISVIAALAVLPVAANATAADVDKNPGATIDQTTSEGQTAAANATATNAPKYALVAAHDTDSNVATAGYVKGAYNASIRAINKVAEQVGEGLNDKANANLDNVTAGSVTTTLIADDAVTADKIADGAVGADQLGASAVGTAKIADDAVTADKIADNAVDTAQIADGAVTADKLAAGALDGFATEAGVEQTVSNAINDMTASVDLSDLTVNNAALGGTATASINVMDTWGATEVSQNPVVATVDLTNTMTAVTLSGDSNAQTVTLNKPAKVQYAEPANP